ncbi:hypothetical protein TRVA0_021S02058 [Trichomonascus vanleenenianus]|uniref:uncharacterized protein n=1 Tax=Trichomonascus vanleenenianus TaxID=2268995 RepID=UPI003ECA933B
MSSINTSGSAGSGAASNNSQPIDQETITRYHRGFCAFLGLALIPGYPAIDPIASGNNKARQKLRRLGDNHFNELATDVHDELERRMGPVSGPEHLMFREDMHPKRNMARQKLCVLTEMRFKDLCTDILCEIETRYPYAIPSAPDHDNNERYEMNEISEYAGNGYEYEPLPNHPQESHNQFNGHPQETHDQFNGHPQETHNQFNGHPQETHNQFNDHPQEAHNQFNGHNGEYAPPAPDSYENDHSGSSNGTAVPNYNGGPSNELDELNFNPMDESRHFEDGMNNDDMSYGDDLPININEPISQSLKQTTIVPTKSTLAEESDDDDEDDSGDEFVNSRRSTRRSSIFESSIQLDSIAEEDQPLGQDDEPGLTRQHTISQSRRHTRGISASSDAQRYGSRDITASIGSIVGQITPPESTSATPFFEGDKVHTTHAGSGVVGIGTDDVHEKIRERDEQIKMLVDEGSRMDDAINKLEAQLAESEDLKNNLVSENGRLHETIGDLEMEKDKLNRELREAKDEHERDVTKYLDVIRETEQRLADVHAEHLTLQKHHSEHEERSAELDKQVVGLQTTISRHEETISNLRSEQQQKQQQQQQLQSREASEDPELVDKYEKLRKDHSRLAKELEQQQKVTDQVRQEASAFLEEMRTLASSQSSWENVEALNLEVQKLKLEVQDWKNRYLRTKNNLKSARSSMYMSRTSNAFRPSPPPIEEDSPFYDAENGKIRTSSVTRFQVAMDEFLIKSRTDAGNLLDNLHNLVVATRVVSQDITESSSDAIDGERQSQIAQCTSLVSNTANSLISTTRNHLTSGGLAPISVLDATAADLSSAVIELIKVAKVRLGGEETIEIEPRPDSAEFEGRPSPDVPKGFYGRDSFADGYQRNSRDFTTHRDEDSTDYETTTVSTNLHNQPSQTTENSMNRQSRPRSSRILDEEADKEIRVLRKRFASNYSVHNLIQNFDIEDPDNTVAELQEYLEEQTFGVIEAIQNLLTGIKNNATMGEIRPYLETITNVLDQMVEATGNSMNQTRNWKLKDKGKYILDLLADCAVRLHNLKVDCGVLDDSAHPDKHLKHRFAALTYDITKRTNELVKTVEVFSLTAEVQEIDQKLGVVDNQI